MTDPQPFAEVMERVVEALHHVYDPEIPVNIYDLGLVYALEPTAGENGKTDLRVAMTLTTANCPLADMIPGMVHDSLAKIEDLGTIKVELVWDPPWDPSRMSDEARLALDMF